MTRKVKLKRKRLHDQVLPLKEYTGCLDLSVASEDSAADKLKYNMKVTQYEINYKTAVYSHTPHVCVCVCHSHTVCMCVCVCVYA